MSDYQRWYDSLGPSTQMLIDRKYGEIVWNAAISFTIRPKFFSTFRYRDEATNHSICAVVLWDDPTNIHYGFDLLSKDQIIPNEDEFFISILPALTHRVPFHIKSKIYLTVRSLFLLRENPNRKR